MSKRTLSQIQAAEMSFLHRDIYLNLLSGKRFLTPPELVQKLLSYLFLKEVPLAVYLGTESLVHKNTF